MTIDQADQPKVFAAYSKYYDLLYADKDYSAETNYIASLLSNNGVAFGSILELGSGTGKHANLLADYGYRITGVEKSKAMLEHTQENKNCEFILGDITQFKTQQKFDAVTSLFHVVSYITNDQDLDNLFKNTNFHLNQGGLFVFDVWHSPAVKFNPPEVRVKKIANDEYEVTRIAEPVIFENENIVEVNYTIFCKHKQSGSIIDFLESHRMRHFSYAEIMELSKRYGFDLIRSEEFLTEKSPSKDTWGVCYILKKSFSYA